jgi:sugar/nucleoside kinase (ribokinase family)
VTSPPAIVVVGDVMIDILVQPSGPIREGTDTPARIRPAGGGSGANQAAWLARAGNRVVFLGRGGAREHDEQCRLLAAWGVEPHLGADVDVPTGTVVNLIAPDGQRSFLTDRGANDTLGAADLDSTHLVGARLLHVSGYALSASGPRAAVRAFIEEAVVRDVPVSVDPASSALLQAVGPAAFMEWTHRATLCIVNADEAALLAGTDDLAEQLRVLAAHYGTVVVKRGPHGAAAARGEERWSYPAPRVQVLDTTGAGDAFLAAFVTARLRGAAMELCLQAGVQAGSAATTHLGGRPPREAGIGGV